MLPIPDEKHHPITFTLTTLSQTYLLIFLQNPFEMSLSVSKFLKTYSKVTIQLMCLSKPIRRAKLQQMLTENILYTEKYFIQ